MVDMKNMKHRIVDAVVTDNDLSETQMKDIFKFLKTIGVNDPQWNKKYNVNCTTCKKNLNDEPLSFIKARRLQLQHKRKRERYVGHVDSYCHSVQLIEIKPKRKSE